MFSGNSIAICELFTWSARFFQKNVSFLSPKGDRKRLPSSTGFSAAGEILSENNIENAFFLIKQP
jgi:hypothetical protein